MAKAAHVYLPPSEEKARDELLRNKFPKFRWPTDT